MENINAVMAQLAQYQRMQDETAQIIDGLKDEIKAYMASNNLETLTGDEHKATYKPVESSRIDTKALKNELPDIATRYTTTTSTMRFTFS